jgi:CRISPR/Cas system type I-B associated protein Csh2 (Cas7 group RAMP superfamily)
MNTKANGDLINESKPRVSTPQQQTIGLSANDIKNIVRETVQDVLKENGLLVESTKKSNEQFKFRVGQHLFEGRVTKIRKISE